MINMVRNTALAAAMAALAAPVAVQATDARDLGYVRGMDARDAERALRSRGFDRVSSQRDRGSTISFWWDDDDCVRVDEYDGEIVSLVDASDRDCRTRRGDSRWGDRDDRDDRRGRRDRDRDWRSGDLEDLEGVRVYDALRELERRGFRQVDEYRSGYARYSVLWNARSRQCLRTRVSNGRIDEIERIRSHEGCGTSYGSRDEPRAPDIDWYPSLVGDAAPGARQRLINAGFASVFIENAGRRTIYYNRASGQCLEMRAENHRVTAMRDIGRHSVCR